MLNKSALFQLFFIFLILIFSFHCVKVAYDDEIEGEYFLDSTSSNLNLTVIKNKKIVIKLLKKPHKIEPYDFTAYAINTLHGWLVKNGTDAEGSIFHFENTWETQIAVYDEAIADEMLLFFSILESTRIKRTEVTNSLKLDFKSSSSLLTFNVRSPNGWYKLE